MKSPVTLLDVATAANVSKSTVANVFNRPERVRQEVAKKLSETDSANKQNRMLAEQAREASSEAQVKLGILENRLAESQNQQIALETLSDPSAPWRSRMS